MGLRIHARSPYVPQNPYLSAGAALATWLPPAIAATGQPPLDHVITARRGAAADVTTWLGRGGWPDGAVLVSAVQARLSSSPPAAVIPVPLDGRDLPVNEGQHKDLVTVFDGQEDAALIAALDVAKRAGRRLTVVMEADLEPSSVAAEILADAASQGAAQVVTYGPDDVPSALAEAAAYLATAKCEYDMGAVTAMACGTPVIALDGTLVTDVLVHGESGYIAGSVEDAADWLDFLPALRPAQGRVRARMLFDPQMVALRYAEVYRAAEREEPLHFQHPEYGRRERELAIA